MSNAKSLRDMLNDAPLRVVKYDDDIIDRVVNNPAMVAAMASDPHLPDILAARVAQPVILDAGPFDWTRGTQGNPVDDIRDLINRGPEQSMRSGGLVAMVDDNDVVTVANERTGQPIIHMGRRTWDALRLASSLSPEQRAAARQASTLPTARDTKTKHGRAPRSTAPDRNARARAKVLAKGSAK